MNNAATTQINHEKYCYKVLFDIVPHTLGIIHNLIQSGMIITMDANLKHACAHFDNTIDYNEFKDKIKHLSCKKASA